MKLEGAALIFIVDYPTGTFPKTKSWKLSE